MKKKKQKFNYEKCRKCVFKMKLDGLCQNACGYLFMTGKMRPCEGGKDCTAYLELKSNQELRKELLGHIRKIPMPRENSHTKGVTNDELGTYC